MPDTFQALSVLLLAVLPGAIFIYALERWTGAWGVKAADRFLRFVVLSALFQLIALPVSFILWRKFVLADYLEEGPRFPWPLYGLAICYFAIPAAVGSVCGLALHANQSWARRVFREQVTAPRAFDYLFGREPNGYVRILLKIDPPTWVGGAFVTVSEDNQGFVGRYPEVPDIWLPVRLAVDQHTGEFQRDPQTGRFMREPGGILVDGSSIAYLEFIEPVGRI